jgi:hypothetical protein
MFETIRSEKKKQAKLQWLQDPRQTNDNNLNTERHKASSNFRKKEGISERQN